MAKKTSIIIGLAGRKRSGKTTASDLLVELGKKKGLTPIRLGFADPLKAEIAKIFGPITEQNKGTLRATLQAAGSAMKELRGNDVWLNRHNETWNSYQEHGYNMLIVDDVRFPNESRHLKSLGATVWRIKRPSTDDSGDTHTSETSVDSIQPDVTISEEDLNSLLDKVTNTWHECFQHGHHPQ